MLVHSPNLRGLKRLKTLLNPCTAVDTFTVTSLSHRAELSNTGAVQPCRFFYILKTIYIEKYVLKKSPLILSVFFFKHGPTILNCALLAGCHNFYVMVPSISVILDDLSAPPFAQHSPFYTPALHLFVCSIFSMIWGKARL